MLLLQYYLICFFSPMYPQLNFDIIPQFKIKKQLQKKYIFDRVRKKYIILTPEEWVRQHVIEFLIEKRNFSAALMTVERGLKYNKLQKRFDLRVHNSLGEVLLLVECKAPNVSLTEETFMQSLTYAQKSKPTTIMLTNGLHHVYYDCIKKMFVNHLP